MNTPPNDTYTHGHHESVLQGHRWRTAENSAAYLLPHLRPGQSLLDVGCGPGTITAELADHLGPNGEVCGIDRGEQVIAGAAVDLSRPGLRFEVADVYRLPYDDERWDVVHAHQVLQHLTDPVAALTEMYRVSRPGAYLAVRDSDYRNFSFAPRSPELDRWQGLYRDVARRNGGEPDAAPLLSGWVRAAGFEIVSVSASIWCFASSEEREWWGTSWIGRATESDFATQAVEYGLSTPDELAEIADGWRTWSESSDGVLIIPHGEVIARRPH